MTDLISREAAISELTLRRSLLDAQNVVTNVCRDLSIYDICIDALRTLPTQAPAAVEYDMCRCGAPMSKNPHPQAGIPSMVCEFGAVYVCIPCAVSSRHRWAERAQSAEALLAAQAPAVSWKRQDDAALIEAMIQQLHRDYCVSKGRDPQKYLSRYSMALEVVRECRGVLAYADAVGGAIPPYNRPNQAPAITECDYCIDGKQADGETDCPCQAAAIAVKGNHPDDVAVDRFAVAMKTKLSVKRAEGRGGWDGPSCDAEFLSSLLREHVDKGDPLDVGNLAMMLHQRGEKITQSEAQAPATPCPCTLIEQDDDCPVGQPSLLCGVCSGTGNTTPDKVQALAAEMLRIASDLGEPEDPFAAWENLQGGAAQAPAVGVADVDAVIDIVLQEVHGPLWRAILSSEDCLNRVCTDKTPESCICAPKIDRIESHARSQAKARILAAIEPAQGGEA